MSDKYHPLPDFLKMFVSLAIAEYQRKGGPKDYDFAHIQNYGPFSEATMFKVKGESRREVAKLVNAIAVMAFVPGGITIFGHHFEATAEGNELATLAENLLGERSW